MAEVGEVNHQARQPVIRSGTLVGPRAIPHDCAIVHQETVQWCASTGMFAFIFSSDLHFLLAMSTYFLYMLRPFPNGGSNM